MIRPTWDEYWFRIVEDASTRSTCLHRHVGAVIIKENIIISMGYNGSTIGLKNCSDIGVCSKELHNAPKSNQGMEFCRGSHAEENAIIFAARTGRSVQGATLYCIYKPCVRCAMMITQAGIQKVYYVEEYEKVSGEIVDYIFLAGEVECLSKNDLLCGYSEKRDILEDPRLVIHSEDRQAFEFLDERDYSGLDGQSPA